MLFQLIIVAALIVMATFVYIAIRSTDYYLQRVQWAHQQHEAVTALSVNANRYSEQIAEFLLIGEPERSDYDSARAELEAGFDRLEEVTTGEIEFLGGIVRGDDKRDELFRIERMQTLYAEIDRATANVIELRNQGRQEEAIRVFRREIENRLDAEFQNLLKAASLDELDEVERTGRRAEAVWSRLTWTTVGLALAAIVLCLVAASLLARSLVRPIDLLTKGTEAISRGELDHRIVFDSHDELGTLAKRFNEMAAHQEDQRDRLVNARAELEREVVARTAELAAANQRLTELDRLRVQFLADISHELRTPLTALRGEAEIPLRHGSKPEAVYRDALERIVAQSGDMARLLDDLVFLSRSETDTIRFEPRRVDLVTIVSDAVHDGETLGRSKTISVDAEYGKEPIWLTADAPRLKQALMILLDNAIKYSPRGRSVQLRMAAGNGHAEIVVRDEGRGIAPEDLSRVFERFYRGRGSKASLQPGSGLGLSIAKWLIEKHNGDIALTSEVGSFTEVRVRIPCTDQSSL
ncbi:HAMP domain-containing histidine kinase [Rhizobiaceae bacterium n13]|uniref:histidine kinase n=1 Tax=Ferirhizobium litorale TaxID=2927786 RepID=A0AAE3U5C4_9HYPH|nr:ATP-binding protein [Fererhizobium litorale]MDI7862805.1 HAMP domain-containing histidine kinase [Fererhizobium litorale]MDI7923909.1 HAMP domain-containing histidine kinase [Fererhizobium litorale]